MTRRPNRRHLDETCDGTMSFRGEISVLEVPRCSRAWRAAPQRHFLRPRFCSFVCSSRRKSPRRSKLCSQNRRYCASQSSTSLSARGSMRHGRHWAARPRTIRPARSSTLRCLETAGRLMSKGSASSVTETSPSESRARMARRVGSANAAKVVLRRSAGIAYKPAS